LEDVRKYEGLSRIPKAPKRVEVLPCHLIHQLWWLSDCELLPTNLCGDSRQLRIRDKISYSIYSNRHRRKNHLRKEVVVGQPRRCIFPSDLFRGEKGCLGLPMQLGHIALTRIPSGASGFANDLTAPTTPCFEVPYIGAMGKG
jgi:hypothetical protein